MRGIEVVRCQEVGLREAADEEHLDYASEHDYVIVTRDRDFVELAEQWWERDLTPPGIMYIPVKHRGNISLIVAELSRIDGSFKPEDTRGMFWYVRRRANS